LFVGWVERSETHQSYTKIIGEIFRVAMGFAEPVIGRRFAPTRWLNPSYDPVFSIERSMLPPIMRGRAKACFRRSLFFAASTEVDCHVN
jgi:hypothetical protein